MAPKGVPAGRMYVTSSLVVIDDSMIMYSQREINWRCELSFGFDTTEDYSFYNCAEVILISYDATP
jgi:hypothetical protein